MKRAPRALKMKDDDDNYPLHTIIDTVDHHENERLLQPMLEGCPEAIRKFNIQGNAPLHCAFVPGRGAFVSGRSIFQ
jgi:hypothetical protein